MNYEIILIESQNSKFVDNWRKDKIKYNNKKKQV